jgi:magnesium chelatase family protein
MQFPAAFLMVAAMNPCPCGYLGDQGHECTCTLPQIQRYNSQISGPLLDRIDIHVEVPAVPFKDIKSTAPSKESCTIREKVARARDIQSKRFNGLSPGYTNSRMEPRDLDKHCRLDDTSQNLLEKAANQLSLSARACHRVIKISRTIADLAGQENIGSQHVAEAIQYRRSSPRIC